MIGCKSVLRVFSDKGLCTSNEGRSLKFYCMNIVDDFWVRSSIDVLDPENMPGSGKIRTGSGSRAYRGRLTPKV